MKKFLPLILLISTICSAQNIRSYNISVNQGDESQVGELFKEFHGKHKRKSGTITLQRVQFLNDVTHRILLTGNPNNWGWEMQPPESEWQAYRRGNMAYRKSAPGSYTGKSLYWKDGDRSKYNVGRQWFFKVNDRVKFAAAYVKFAKAIEPIIGERLMGIGSLEMGDLKGASHYTVFYGESMNDLELMSDKVRATKAYQEFIKSNGGSEAIVSFSVRDIIRY